MVYDWVGSSYLPSDQSKDYLDNRYGYYQKYRHHWTMRPESDGDMTNLENINYLHITYGNTFDFYSSDAGLGVESDFNDQEELKSQLHTGCDLAALRLLRTRGWIILKQYTLFKRKPIITFLQYCCFEKLFLVKPVTSRPYNSELYIVVINFKGETDPDVVAATQVLTQLMLGHAIELSTIRTEGLRSG